jgi:hypothetical protein
MFLVFLILTIISLIALIAGFIWLLASRGSVERRSGAQVGAEVMSAVMDDDEEDDGVALSTSKETRAFRGTGSQVRVEASYSFAEIKDHIATGHWEQAAPALLAIGGMFGLLFFGALTLFLTLEERWVGYLLLIIVAYSVIRVAIGFARS